MATGTKYLGSYREAIRDLLGTDRTENLSNNEMNRSIRRAVAKYSIDAPLRKANKFTGSDDFRYTLPTDWEWGFSIPESLEWPASDSNHQAPTYLKYSDWDITNNGTSNALHFFSITPGTSDDFTLHYTVRHTVAASSSTVPDADFEALSFLCASYAALALAGKLLRNRDSMLAADGVNFRTQSDNYRSQAKDLFRTYKDHMGLPEKGPKGADFYADIDVEPPWGTGYLTHGSR